MIPNCTPRCDWWPARCRRLSCLAWSGSHSSWSPWMQRGQAYDAQKNCACLLREVVLMNLEIQINHKTSAVERWVACKFCCDTCSPMSSFLQRSSLLTQGTQNAATPISELQIIAISVSLPPKRPLSRHSSAQCVVENLTLGRLFHATQALWHWTMEFEPRKTRF